MQNFSNRRIAVVVLGNSDWKAARLHTNKIAAVVDAAIVGSYAEVEIPFR